MVQWDLEIKPKRNLLDLRLKHVWNYKFLTYLFVRRDFVARYKQTILGPLWFLVVPLFNVFIYTFVFAGIAKISTDSLPAPLFYLSGLTIWNYFAACLSGTSSTFVNNAGLFGKIYFPRLTVPISIITSNILQFLIQFILLIGFIIFFYINGFHIHLSYYIFLIP